MSLFLCVVITVCNFESKPGFPSSLPRCSYSIFAGQLERLSFSMMQSSLRYECDVSMPLYWAEHGENVMQRPLACDQAHFCSNYLCLNQNHSCTCNYLVFGSVCLNQLTKFAHSITNILCSARHISFLPNLSVLEF